jgi:uncharacterized SAM-binding protein YcdF (DUF218 family)
MPRMRRYSVPNTELSWRRVLRLTGLLLLTAGLLTVVVWLELPGIGHWLAEPTNINQVDAIVVLGSNSRRSQYGISLYEQGLASEFWHTGDVLWLGKEQSPAQSAAQLAIEHGVPAEDIYMLATTSTWEDGQKIAALVKERQTQSILIVTSWYHSHRALCVIKQQLADSGVTIYYAAPTDVLYGPEDWWLDKYGRITILTELVKIGYYWIRYGVSPWNCN